MSESPVVSVVITCHDLGAYLDQAVQSVLNQTYRNFEIIIVDDGSTDAATRLMLTTYLRPHTQIVRTEHLGLAGARNLGARKAGGRYISFINADSVFEPTFLERTVEVLQSNPSVSFASCWLKTFGEVEFQWSPSTYEFPRLLAEDPICTAALMRTDVLRALDAFDSHMPVAGYEDWDLAITLVERGFHGAIIPEYLFRDRIRAGSMSAVRTAPDKHARLMRYLVEKHPDSYQKHLPGVLETIEIRTNELHGSYLPVHSSGTDVLDRLESTLRNRPGELTPSAPRASVVITCHDQGPGLAELLQMLVGQSVPELQIIVVDDDSADPITLRVLAACASAGLPVVRTSGIGSAAARNTGLGRAQADYIFALGAEQTVDPELIVRAVESLDANHTLAFVASAQRDLDATGFAWSPESADLAGILACTRLPFPIVRRTVLDAVGGYDVDMPTPTHADADLIIRLMTQGQQGIFLPEPLIGFRISSAPHLIGALFHKHRILYEAHWQEVTIGQENLRRRLQSHIDPPKPLASRPSPVEPIDWGGLRRIEPISSVWGVDRGQPVDRYYIEQFLDRHKQDIRGRVLEVKDPGYTSAYGIAVEQADVVDVAPQNPSATLIRDLGADASLPARTYDCFILTQTIHIIYDVRTVLRNALRTLRPGGVLLATLPCVSRVDYESGLMGDCWRFTPASAKRLFEEAFGVGQVEVEVRGNVLACTSFLMGISAGELSPEELDHTDPYFPLILCIRAVRAPKGSRGVKAGREKALVLMYHRVARPIGDRWNLCVSPENFAAHMRHLARDYEPLRLSELATLLGAGEVPHRAVAVTFDDGYRDNLLAAMPILRESRVPATFFISGDGAVIGDTFWWEVLNRSLDKMSLDEDAARALHRRLMNASIEERNAILSTLPPPDGPLPPRLTAAELAVLAGEPLVEVGAHGWSHRAFTSLTPAEQDFELTENLKVLSKVAATEIRSFAHPFGAPFTEGTSQILREAGIRTACTVAGEPVTSTSNPLALPRVEVNNWDGAEFEARLFAFFDE